MYVLERRQVIYSSSIDEVFVFFEKAENLAKITPGWLNFQIKTPTPVRMQLGTEIEYTIKWLGVRVRWKTRITGYDPPNKFVDEQTAGPYNTWIHLHLFEPAEQGVLMTDRVRYRMPFGFLGRIIHYIIVRKQLNRIFDYRSTRIEEIFLKRNT